MMEQARYYALQQLYAQYASAVDSGDWDRWLGLFTEDCIYKIQPRENFERGYPLATLFFESKGMLKDRIYAIRETLFHDPYYQCHITGPVHVRSASGAHIVSEANYAVFRTKPSQLTSVFNVGRYIDRIVSNENGLQFSERLCIYDSEMIPNSIIYPI
jgi:salicylate 5-hydroxylase small subunit